MFELPQLPGLEAPAVAPGYACRHPRVNPEDSIPGVVDAIASRAGKSGLRFLDRTGREVRW